MLWFVALLITVVLLSRALKENQELSRRLSISNDISSKLDDIREDIAFLDLSHNFDRELIEDEIDEWDVPLLELTRLKADLEPEMEEDDVPEWIPFHLN